MLRQWRQGMLCLKQCHLYRYAAKMEHEGAAMYDAAVALRDAMIELGLACDGGKDSLSMAASAGGEVSLQLSALPCLLVYLLGVLALRNAREYLQQGAPESCRGCIALHL